jgi:hypothetical protein
MSIPNLDHKSTLNLSTLDRVRERGDKTISRCPLCAEEGHDRSGDHLAIIGDFVTCIKDPDHGFEVKKMIQGDWEPDLEIYKSQITPKAATEARPSYKFWSETHDGNRDELEELRSLRNLPVSDGLDIAQRCGVLTFGTNRGMPAWAIRRGDDLLEWRRMDGQPWEHGGKSDSWCRRPGAKKSMVGAHLLGDYRNVLMVEGGPDIAAGFIALELEDAIADWGIVGLVGSNPLEPEDVALLAGRRIRIAAHDEHDFKAARTWAGQLQAAGCTVEPLDLEGMDLDEWIAAGGEVFHA